MGDSTDTTDSGSSTQDLLANLFATGASAYVDSQYAQNHYYPNTPQNYNAGVPAGTAVSTGFLGLSNTGVIVLAVVAIAFFALKHK